MSKTTTAKVIKLFVTKGNDKEKTRESVSKISVDSSGIVGDKFYGKNSSRAILITAIQSYDMALENGINIDTGSLGENILININPYALLPGQKIKIGNTMLEITQNCTLCKGLSTLNSKLPKLLKDDRGIFAKYVEGDTTISLNDSVELLK